MNIPGTVSLMKAADRRGDFGLNKFASIWSISIRNAEHHHPRFERTPSALRMRDNANQAVSVRRESPAVWNWSHRLSFRCICSCKRHIPIWPWWNTVDIAECQSVVL